MRYKEYEEYRNIKFDYVKKIPSHWTICSWRYITKILTDYTANGSFKDLADNVKYLDYKSYARVVRLTDLRKNMKNEGIYVNEDAYNFLSKSSLAGGEFLISNVGAYSGLILQMPNINYKATLGPNMMMAKFNEKVLNRFMIHLGQSEYIKQQFSLKANSSSAQPKLNKEDFRSIKFLLPPIEEQEKIVEFLDKKTSEIDGIIEEKEKLIELLKEKREAIITEAVTKGLDKNVKMKDSGVDWIGIIPEEWECIKIKYIFDIIKNIAGKTGFDILSVTQKGIKIKDISKNNGQISMDYSKYQMVNVGDFVMNHMDLLTGWVDCSRYIGVTSPDYRVFRIKDDKKFSREYYKYIMQLCYSTKIFYGLGQGVSNLGRWRLQTDKFKEFKVPVPSKEEQNKIVNFIENRCKNIDYICENIVKEIVFLKEYKKSLISEVVTGKIDVRNKV